MHQGHTTISRKKRNNQQRGQVIAPGLDRPEKHHVRKIPFPVAQVAATYQQGFNFKKLSSYSLSCLLFHLQMTTLYPSSRSPVCIHFCKSC